MFLLSLNVVFVCVWVFCCSGQSGLGKSTLMNTLFKSKVSRKSVQPNPEERIPKTIEIKSISHGRLDSLQPTFIQYIIINVLLE